MANKPTTAQKNQITQDIVKYIGNQFAFGKTQAATLADTYDLSIDDVRDIENRVKTVLGRAILPPELLSSKTKPFEGD